jgi:hypothetical protein
MLDTPDLTLSYLRDLRTLLTQVSADVLSVHRQWADGAAIDRYADTTNARLLEIEAQLAKLEAAFNHRLDGVNGRLHRIEDHLGIPL